MAFCYFCGNEIYSDMQFCPVCGKQTQDINPNGQNNQAMQQTPGQQMPYPNQGMAQSRPMPNQGISYSNQGMPQMQPMPNQRMQQYPYQGTQYPYQGTPYPNQGMPYPNQGMPPVPPVQPYSYQGMPPVPKKKKKKKVWIPIVLITLFSIIAVSALLLIFVITAFLFPGFLRKKPQNDSNGIIVETRPTKYDDSSNTQALLDYADRLEEQGNYEAAAKVRELIPKAAEGEINQEIEERINDNPKMNYIQKFDETLDYIELLK